MSDLPGITETDVRLLVDPSILGRGRDYFKRGQVQEVVWRDGFLLAEVQGQQYEPYQVRIVADARGVQSTSCTCPYGGRCKHIAAVLLYLVHRRDEIEQLPSLSTLLEGWSREQLLTLLMRLSENDPRLAAQIERLTPVIGMQAGDSAESEVIRPTINASLLRRQIIADVKSAVQSGYDEWGDDAIYDSDLGQALEPALEQARALLAANDSHAALELLQIATEAWQSGVEQLDEELVELLFDNGFDTTNELGAIWAEALLTADLTPAERAGWARRLQKWVDDYYGCEDLAMAVTAVRQGWDHPPLVAAMQGNITNQGIWQDEEVPEYADELAQIRLSILARRGQHEAYLNLAEAEGQFMSYLQMLVTVGQVDKAFQEGLSGLRLPQEFQELANTLVQYGALEQALTLARHGVDLPEATADFDHPMYLRGLSHRASLAVWLREQASAAGRAELALWAAQQAFMAAATLPNYQALEEVAGADWPARRLEALAALRHAKVDLEQKVQIYLHEKMHQEAIDAVKGNTWYYGMDKLIESVKGTHPTWAFQQCRLRAEAIMDAGRSKDYTTAAEWLHRGRDILIASGAKPDWESYLNAVLEKHQRKYSLVPLLKALR